MLTLQALQEAGVNTKEGLARCMNNESFYLNLVTKALMKDDCDKLKTAIEAGDLDSAFSAAHNLKGSMGNLAITPIYKPVAEMTELLRSRTQTDYTPYLDTVMQQKETLASLLK